MNADRLLVAGVIFLTILYLWIVHASYAPAIIVGEGRNQCLTGNDCGSAWECLWPCGAGHLWGTDDPNGWECLWPCPECKETVYWEQNWEFSNGQAPPTFGCDLEAGAPLASVDFIYSYSGTDQTISCDMYLVNNKTEGVESQFRSITTSTGADYVHNYDLPDFSSVNPIYFRGDFYWTSTIYGIAGEKIWAPSDGAVTPTLRYPQVRHASGFLFAPKWLRVYCTDTTYIDIAVSGMNHWNRIFIDYDQGDSTTQRVTVYTWAAAVPNTWLKTADGTCTTDQANAFDGLVTGHTDVSAVSFGMMDNMGFSNCPFPEPGLDPDLTQRR